MTTYTIQIWNQTRVPKSYAAYMTLTDQLPPNVLANAWITFPHVGPGGFDSMTYDNSLYAFWGTTPGGFSPGTVVQSGGVIQVDLAQRDMAFFNADLTGFDRVEPNRAQPGTVGITSNAFHPQAGYVFGLAKVGRTPIPTPILTTPGLPNMTYMFTPGTKVLVTDGEQRLGAVADLTEVTHGAEVDFTGRPQTTATTIQAADGSWSVTYS